MAKSNTNLFSIVLETDVQNLTGLKSRCRYGWFLLEVPRRESVSLPFSASRGCLHSLVHCPLLAALTLLDSIVTSPITHSGLLPFSYKDFCGYIRPTWIIQDNLPISRLLTNHIFKVPFAIYGNIHRSQELGCRHLSGAIIKPTWWVFWPLFLGVFISFLFFLLHIKIFWLSWWMLWCIAQISPSGPKHSFAQLLGGLAPADSQMSLSRNCPGLKVTILP